MKKGYFLTLVGLFVIIATIVVVSDLMKNVPPPIVATNTPSPTSTPGPNTPSSASRELPNITLTVPDTQGNPKITLSNGKGVYIQGDNKAWIIMLPDKTAERSSIRGTDLFGIYTVNYGGSGVFYYLGLFFSEGGTITQQGAELLGSQLHITALDIMNDPTGAADYEVVVNYLELAPSQTPLATPKVATKKEFKVKDHKFLPQ